MGMFLFGFTSVIPFITLTSWATAAQMSFGRRNNSSDSTWIWLTKPHHNIALLVLTTDKQGESPPPARSCVKIMTHARDLHAGYARTETSCALYDDATGHRLGVLDSEGARSQIC